MSSASRVKPKTSKFSLMLLGVTDFGITTRPLSRCQRMITWAAVRLCFVAMAPITGSCSSLPWPSGLHDSVATLRGTGIAQGLLLKARVQLDLVEHRRDEIGRAHV